MSVHHIEKICERCGKLYVAKSGNQKFCIKCGNIVNKENIKKQQEEKRKQRILKKTS